MFNKFIIKNDLTANNQDILKVKVIKLKKNCFRKFCESHPWKRKRTNRWTVIEKTKSRTKNMKIEMDKEKHRQRVGQDNGNEKIVGQGD
jgi:hypothetical protein